MSTTPNDIKSLTETDTINLLTKNMVHYKVGNESYIYISLCSLPDIDHPFIQYIKSKKGQDKDHLFLYSKDGVSFYDLKLATRFEKEDTPDRLLFKTGELLNFSFDTFNRKTECCLQVTQDRACLMEHWCQPGDRVNILKIFLRAAQVETETVVKGWLSNKTKIIPFYDPNDDFLIKIGQKTYIYICAPSIGGSDSLKVRVTDKNGWRNITGSATIQLKNDTVSLFGEAVFSGLEVTLQDSLFQRISMPALSPIFESCKSRGIEENDILQHAPIHITMKGFSTPLVGELQKKTAYKAAGVNQPISLTPMDGLDIKVALSEKDIADAQLPFQKACRKAIINAALTFGFQGFIGPDLGAQIIGAISSIGQEGPIQASDKEKSKPPGVSPR